MLFAIWMVLAWIQLAKTGYVQDRQPPELSYASSSELIKTIAHKLELLEATSQNIQLKLHTSSMFNYQQFEELKAAIYALDGYKDDEKKCLCNATGTFADLAATSAAGGFSSVGPTIDENANASAVASTVPTVALASNATGFSTVLPSFCRSGQNGIQLIQIPNSKLSPFFVNCIQDIQQGEEPWILVQRRRDGSIDFYRDWCDYQQGFGNLEGEFFMGLDKLHALTQSALFELWIQMEDFNNATRWARYSSFAIGNEHQAYDLNILGSFTGNAGDSLTYHQGQKFSTRDRDHDKYSLNCAQIYTGAWWYRECHHSNLNGKYLKGEYSKEKTAMGIDWETWHGHNYSLKYAHMAIRPVRSS